MTKAELEKENAELKETLRTYSGCGDWDNDFHTCRVYLQHEELQECMEQLTKAKEIIENLLSDNRTMKAQFESEEQVNVWFEHIHKAEQFISEVEK